MLRMSTALALLIAALVLVAPAQGHLAQPFHKGQTLQEKRHTVLVNIPHVCASKAHTRGCKWLRGLLRKVNTQLRPKSATPWYVTKQIWAGNILGSESAGDPWPNCPDPYDGSGSWQDTVNCENGGNWLDSPGYYRCGLQFDPGWERRFGALCP